jgi:predicted metal-dependent peptidase
MAGIATGLTPAQIEKMSVEEIIAHEQERIQIVRSKVIVQHAFWASILMPMQIRLVTGLPTFAATDCVDHIWINPLWTVWLTLKQLGFVMFHEGGHVAFLHAVREMGRDHHKWNRACDYVVNLMGDEVIDKKSNQKLYERPDIDIPGLGPFRMLYDKQYAGMAAEAVYAMLPKPQAGTCPRCGKQHGAPQNGGNKNQPTPQNGTQPQPQNGTQSQPQPGTQPQTGNQPQNGDQPQAGGQQPSPGQQNGKGQQKGKGTQPQPQSGSGQCDLPFGPCPQNSNGNGNGQGTPSDQNGNPSDPQPGDGSQTGDPNQGQGGGGSGSDELPDFGNCHCEPGITDIHLPKDMTEHQQQDLVDRIIQAHETWKASNQRGEMPAGLLRHIQKLREAKVPWGRILQQYAGQVLTKEEYCLSRPHKRWLQHGIIRPTLHSESLGKLVAHIDTSGSIGREELEDFGAEVAKLHTYAEETLILVGDAKVQQVVRTQEVPAFLRKLELKGGGGTSHLPIFDYIREHREEPDLFVSLTDLASEFPATKPRYAVIWCVNESHAAGPGWGRILVIPKKAPAVGRAA